MLGIRSVDSEERLALRSNGMSVHDMREIDEFGVVFLLRKFLERVKAAHGLLHVSLDVDYLDPAIAPGVGTTVPGGANFREAHLVMEMLYESELVSSLEIVELNPFLDERGRTARLLVELTAESDGADDSRPAKPALWRVGAGSGRKLLGWPTAGLPRPRRATPRRRSQIFSRSTAGRVLAVKPASERHGTLPTVT